MMIRKQKEVAASTIKKIQTKGFASFLPTLDSMIITAEIEKNGNNYSEMKLRACEIIGKLMYEQNEQYKKGSVEKIAERFEITKEELADIVRDRTGLMEIECRYKEACDLLCKYSGEYLFTRDFVSSARAEPYEVKGKSSRNTQETIQLSTPKILELMMLQDDHRGADFIFCDNRGNWYAGRKDRRVFSLRKDDIFPLVKKDIVDKINHVSGHWEGSKDIKFRSDAFELAERTGLEGFAKRQAIKEYGKKFQNGAYRDAFNIAEGFGMSELADRATNRMVEEQLKLYVPDENISSLIYHCLSKGKNDCALRLLDKWLFFALSTKSMTDLIEHFHDEFLYKRIKEAMKEGITDGRNKLAPEDVRRHIMEEFNNIIDGWHKEKEISVMFHGLPQLVRKAIMKDRYNQGSELFSLYWEQSFISIEKAYRFAYDIGIPAEELPDRGKNQTFNYYLSCGKYAEAIKFSQIAGMKEETELAEVIYQMVKEHIV